VKLYLFAVALGLAVFVAIVDYAIDGAMNECRTCSEPNPPIALVLPKPLPECWKLDMQAAEYRFAATSARLNGYGAEAAMWSSIAAEEEARPCVGERWEPEQ
jgi:hypothetical protein